MVALGEVSRGGQEQALVGVVHPAWAATSS